MLNKPNQFDNLSLTVWEGADGELELKSVDLFYLGGQTRMYFSKTNRLADMLVPDLSQDIFDCLGTGPSLTNINSFPDFAYQGDAAALFKMRVLVSGAAGQRRRFMMRFKYVIGDLQSLFTTPITISLPSAYQRERVCTEVLGDIALPLLNLISCDAGQELDGRLIHGYQGLQMRSDELKFYISLLTRYSGAAANFSAPSPIALSPEMIRH